MSSLLILEIHAFVAIFKLVISCVLQPFCYPLIIQERAV